MQTTKRYCNHILIVIASLFTKLHWTGDSEGTFGLKVKLPPAHQSTTHGGGFTPFLFIAKRQTGKMCIPIIIINYCKYQFGLT